MQRIEILAIMKEILQRQDKTTAFAEEASLQDIGFRSLDFSELALRVEMVSGNQMSFDAAPLRAIRTVRDLLDFMERAHLGHTNRNQLG
jgi:acyl carrier protein